MKKDNFVIPDIEQPGVYGILNIKTDKMYVGSALNLKNRLKQQRQKMHAWNGLNNLMSADMQSPEDIYNFVFVVLKVYHLDKKFNEWDLRRAEEDYIAKMTKKGLSYNVHKETTIYGFKRKPNLTK